MLALPRCSTALALSLRYASLSLRSSAISSQPSATARALFLRPQSALFHQSKAKANPELNKTTSVLSSGSALDGDLLGMGMWSLGLGAIGAALAGIFLANTDFCLPKSANASLEHLADADLRSTVNGDEVIKAKSLWERNGAVIMAVRRPG